MNKMNSYSKFLRILPKMVLILSCLSMIASAYFFWVWWINHQANLDIRSKTLLTQKIQLHEAQKAYNKGYLQAGQGRQLDALQSFSIAEVAADDGIRARTKFAIGNLYFDMAMRSADIAAGGAHQQAVAQIELARGAYKDVLRLRPELYEARFNLELLDRLSPEKRVNGWEAETDGVTLKPFKRNGTAMMRDNKRRGLP